MMYKINDWNMNRLFVTYMRLRHKDLTKYLSNQAVINYYKDKYIYEFGRVVIYRGIKRPIKSFIKKLATNTIYFYFSAIVNIILTIILIWKM